jgi:hypothetical protein
MSRFPINAETSVMISQISSCPNFERSIQISEDKGKTYTSTITFVSSSSDSTHGTPNKHISSRTKIRFNDPFPLWIAHTFDHDLSACGGLFLL